MLPDLLTFQMRDIDRHDVKETLQRLIKRLPISSDSDSEAGLIYILAAQVKKDGIGDLQIQIKNNEKVVSQSDQRESIKNGETNNFIENKSDFPKDRTICSNKIVFKYRQIEIKISASRNIEL